MKIMTIMGTRPEMIKLHGSIKLLDELSCFEHILVHTGQNYTKELKDYFFRDLDLREPDYNLNINTSSYGQEVSDIISKIFDLLKEIKPDGLLILGDTYSGLSALPARQLGIKIFHMEAGLRAYDKRMPEQANRITIDHISDMLLPYYSYHRENLIRENIHPSKIIVTGNPVFETLRTFELQIRQSTILEIFDVKPNEYFTVTLHRKENVDYPATLTSVLEGLGKLYQTFNKPVIYPIHPRTKQKIHAHNVHVPEGVILHKPLGFYDFNFLNKHAFCLLGDSGTTPEEGYFFKKPVVSIRESTERYETIEGGAHIVAGINSNSIVNSVKALTEQDLFFKYDLSEQVSPSQVVINAIQSKINNYL